jgi:hypothetical protein
MFQSIIFKVKIVYSISISFFSIFGFRFILVILYLLQNTEQVSIMDPCVMPYFIQNTTGYQRGCDALTDTRRIGELLNSLCGLTRLQPAWTKCSMTHYKSHSTNISRTASVVQNIVWLLPK